MAHSIHRVIKAEMALALTARLSGDFDLAVYHLERAHIVGQRFLLVHLSTHIFMLSIAVQRRQKGEILGQLTRLLAVLPGYVLGWVPVGNPGSARVSPFIPMPIPEDLKVYFVGYSLKRAMGRRVALLLLSLLVAVSVAALL